MLRALVASGAVRRGAAVTIRLWPIERRLLAYLDQHGPSRRSEIVMDLASDDSKTGRRRDQGHKRVGGSNGGAPLLMGAWTRRLIKLGWIEQINSKDGFYQHHAITARGRAAFRNAGEAPP